MWFKQTNARIGGMMLGTSETQALIYKHQHPANCSEAPLFVMTSWWGGIGGKINQAASALARAMTQGRVMLFDLDIGSNEFCRGEQGSFCPGEGTYDTCYFEPMSSCTLEDVYGKEFLAMARSRRLTPEELVAKRASLASPRIQFVDSGAGAPWEDTIPMAIRPTWDRAAAMGVGIVALSWWRAQGTAYIVKPNNAMLAEIRRRRTALFAGERMVPGTIAVHVRHGDKWKEAPLIPDEKHLRAAELLWQSSPDLLGRNLFVSTEDPRTIEFFSRPELNITLQYVNVTRSNHMGHAPTEVANPIEEMLDSFVNLDIALEADAMVCWPQSRWCDLMFRLYQTSMCKAKGPFQDPERV